VRCTISSIAQTESSKFFQKHAMATMTVIETAPLPVGIGIELQPAQRLSNVAIHQAAVETENTALTRMNMLKVVAASLSFFFAGNNDGSLGALIPYILRTYSVGTEYVALM
jgi:hypothetical protein